MSKIKLTGSNSGYVEIDSAADAGNLTLQLPTAGTTLLSNADNVFSGITTFTGLNITDDVTFNGASYNVVWDKSDNQLEFGDNAKLSFGAPDIQIYHDSSDNISKIDNLTSNILQIRNLGNNKVIIKTQNSYPVELYYNNSKKLETASGGVTVTGTVAATSYTGDGSALTGIEAGIQPSVPKSVSGITTVLDLSKDDFKITAAGITTIDVRGGSEGNSHTLRIHNSGITTVGFSTYFLFPSGAAPIIPTTDGTISLISFTVDRQGAVGLATQLLAGSSVNFS